MKTLLRATVLAKLPAGNTDTFDSIVDRALERLDAEHRIVIEKFRCATRPGECLEDTDLGPVTIDHPISGNTITVIAYATVTPRLAHARYCH